MRPISSQKRTETLKVHLPSNQKRKNMHFPAFLLVYWLHVCRLCMFLHFWLLGRGLLYRYRTFLLAYWPHICWLCMFVRFWLLGWHHFSSSLPLCLLLCRTFCGCACFCAFGCSLGAPLAVPYGFACLLAVRLPVGLFFSSLLIAR